MLVDTANTPLPGFSIRVLNKEFIAEKPSYRDELALMVATSFAEGEPFCKFLGIDAVKLKAHFVDALVDQAIEDELSLVCLDTEADCIAAAFLNEDFYDTMNADPEAMVSIERGLPELVPMFALLEALDVQLVERRFGGLDGLQPRTVLHAFMVATEKRYTGLGLASLLSKLTADFAKEQGFLHVAVEPTTPVTHHIWTNKLGGTIEYSLATEDFEMPDGTKPFASHKGSVDKKESTIVMLTV